LKDIASSKVPGLGEILKNIIQSEDISPYRINELNFLAAKIEELNESEQVVFLTNIEAGYECKNITSIINQAVSKGDSSKHFHRCIKAV